MNKIKYFVWLNSQVISGINNIKVFFLVITLIIFLKIIHSLILKEMSIKDVGIVGIQILYVPIVLSVGTIFEKTEGIILSIANMLLFILVITNLIYNIKIFIKMKKLRLIIAMFFMIQSILIIFSIFIASMSISGDWI